MPSYKVFYFNVRGRAELVRMMLAYVGQEFEDVRYTREEWAKIKAEVPMQQLPYMEVDGKVIPQSRAMCGFVAREFGLHGANNEETTKIEIVGSTLEDLVEPLIKIFHEADEAKKKEHMAAYYTEKVPIFLAALENILKDNKGGDGFFVGSKISSADLSYFNVMEILNQDALKPYPKLFALKERIAKDPKIAAYLAQRPKSHF